MANILFIDDNQDLGRYTKNSMEEVHHKVDWIRQDTWQAALTSFETLQNDEPWDLLILDIEYPTESWGGIWLYNELVKKGYRDRWSRRVLVYSQYFVGNGNWKVADDSQMFALRVFLHTANIPWDCALTNQDFDRATLLQKIEDVLKTNP